MDSSSPLAATIAPTAPLRPAGPTSAGSAAAPAADDRFGALLVGAGKSAVGDRASSAPSGKRQAVAATGLVVPAFAAVAIVPPLPLASPAEAAPASGTTAGGDGDDDSKVADAPVAASIPFPVAQSLILSLPLAPITATVAQPLSPAPAITAVAATPIILPPAIDQSPAAPGGVVTTAVDPQPIALQQGQTPIIATATRAASTAAAPSIDPPTLATMPTPAVATAIAPAIGATAPARQLFAAAIEAADRQDRAATTLSDPTLATQATAPGQHIVAAATPGDGQQSLDMRQDTWPSAMIDHIEHLRDAADATDTRIRLVPDALGGIDVAISRQADGVHVALHADQPATQAILADARPQLTDLASARGLRLADAAVGGGAAGFAEQQRQPAPRPAAFTTAAATSAPADDPDTTDGRIA